MREPQDYPRVIQNQDIRKSLDAEGRRGRSRLRLESTYGKLYVHGLSKKGSKQARRYLCDCLCGREVYLTAAEIRVRQDLDQGCAHEACEFTRPIVKRWLNVEYSLRKQWASYLYHNPYMIQYSWGGDLAYNKATLDEPTAFENFFRFVKPLTDVMAGKIWVHKRPDTPFLGEESVFITASPTGCLNKPYRYIFNGKKYVKYRDLAKRIGMSGSEVMMKAANSRYSHDAYLALTTHNH